MITNEWLEDYKLKAESILELDIDVPRKNLAKIILSLVNEMQAKRAEMRVRRLGHGKKYDIIYADPPWLYKCGENHLAKKSMINGKYDIHYNSMPIDEIKQINVGEISADNCLLFLWVTSPFLEIGIDLLNAWGFKYSTIGFVWYKGKANPGSYTLSECEICIVGKKGKIPTPRGNRNERQFINELRTEHSSKPNEVRERITRMFPEQKKIELFARTKTKGWDVWGNQVPQSA